MKDGDLTAAQSNLLRNIELAQINYEKRRRDLVEKHLRSMQDATEAFYNYTAVLKAAMASATEGAQDDGNETDCGYACGWAYPYGFVPECGCPVHDPPDERLSLRDCVGLILRFFKKW